MSNPLDASSHSKADVDVNPFSSSVSASVSASDEDFNPFGNASGNLPETTSEHDHGHGEDDRGNDGEGTWSSTQYGGGEAAGGGSNTSLREGVSSSQSAVSGDSRGSGSATLTVGAGAGAGARTGFGAGLGVTSQATSMYPESVNPYPVTNATAGPRASAWHSSNQSTGDGGSAVVHESEQKVLNAAFSNATLRSSSASPSASTGAGTGTSPDRRRVSAGACPSPSSVPTHRASFPSPAKGATGPMDGFVAPLALGVKNRDRDGYCCGLDRELSAAAPGSDADAESSRAAGARGRGEEENDIIRITDAVKMSDGGKSGSYIAYVIQCGSHETRRRYSAFDSLRNALVALYPVLIVPPIPSKQSLTDYAVKGGQSKAKEDATVIARRIRMLEDFLRRVAKHPILSGEHVFHRFLEEDVSWNEVLHSPPLSLLPKNPLHAPAHNPTLQNLSPSTSGNQQQQQGSQSYHTSSEDGAGGEGFPSSEYIASQSPSVPYIAHHLLPTPSASTPLKNPDARFMDSENFTERFANHLSTQMEKVNRRVVKRWGERAHGFSELGALLNGFSLDAKGELQTAIEKFGQAVDSEQMSTALLLQSWEKNATEPLHVYAQYGQIIRKRLAFRHQKHVQYELVQETLEAQREKLQVLERQEREARRLEEALQSGGRGLVAGGGGAGSTLISNPAELEAERERERERLASAASASKKKSGGGVAGGYGLISAVKHSISGMMDVDPEATRRANIGRTRDNISQVGAENLCSCCLSQFIVD